MRFGFVFAFALLVHHGHALFGSKPATKDQALDDVVEEGWEYVSSGSTVKLAHVKSDTRLMLPQVSYGTGSQQQAVTAYTDISSTKNLWLVESESPRGARIACGEKIRLVNSDSSHNLHSHGNHQSPISGAQEVSGFEGRDSGDLWTVECLKDKEAWRRLEPVYFRHVETGWYLQSLPSKKYRQPIVGHQEVSAAKKADSNAQWMALEGYYFSLRRQDPKND
ncbi:hypothetical protein H4S07_001342 [Coemansia furcata]|uniref:Uncharacterized protein n=1 Tax=Coemansia furcata TaxID=417177 RepID=A0ACC1LNZ0_9FUNG|nr:hypothetical protein H4S07_001342 [Coemansia furcata]